MKLAIITGGSQGLGLELVQLLEQENWTVLEISRSGKSRHHIACDLGSDADVDNLLADMHARLNNYQPSELLFVNNAGVLAPIYSLSQYSTQEITYSLAVNVQSPLQLLALVMNTYRSTAIPKTVLNISSGAALKGYAGWSLYCAGKAALHNACLALREEESHQAQPFRIVNVNPFVMDTAMQAQIRAADIEAFPSRPRFEKFHADNVLLTPLQVARAIMTLVQDHGYTEAGFDAKAWVDHR